MNKIQMTTPLVEMDGYDMTRILWKRLKSVSVAFLLLCSIVIPLSCSNDSSYDVTVEDFFYCWPKGIYSGKVIENEPYHNPVIEIITAPIAAPDSLWPCVGHHVSVSCHQHEFHVVDTIVFEMTGPCTRYRTIKDEWWTQIEINE